MKRNFRLMSKAISLLLVLTMIMSASFTVFATDGTQNEILVQASAPQLLGSSTASWALEKLAGGVISGVGGKGANAAFAAIFGAETDAVLAKLEEMSLKMDRIKGDLDYLIKKYSEGKLTTFINEYQSFIGPYEALLELLMSKKKAFADKPVETKEFLMDIYRGDKANFRINADNMLMLTLKLSKKLLQVENKEYNLFGAFDKLDRHVHKWEHQGYESRQEFRDSVLTFYVEFMALSQLACKTAMEDVPEGSYLYINRNEELNELIRYAKLVDQMNKKCTIIKHPDLRIFRDTVKGEDLYAFYQRVDPAITKNPESFQQLMTRDYIKSMTTTTNFSISDYSNQSYSMYRLEVLSAQAGINVLPYIYDSYGGTKTLYEIMFDSMEGNFINVGNLPDKTRFSTNYYLFYEYQSRSAYNQFYRWITKIVDNNGKLKEKERLVSVVYQQHPIYGTRFGVDTLLDEKFFSVMTYPLNLIKQGSLLTTLTLPDDASMISGMDYSYTLPYSDIIDLSVEEKAGASYQWYVDETGIGDEYDEIPGATTKTYSLPILEPYMNGWMYRCSIIENEGTDEAIYTFANPVTLNLTGEGVAEPVTVHNVSNAGELDAALDKVSDGTWGGHTIKLTADITYPNPITLLESGLTIDLNGYTLTIQPSSESEPNINPISNMAKKAAIYALRGNLYIAGNGALKVAAGQGVDYGVYAYASEVTLNNIVLTGGGTTVYSTDGGSVEITGNVSVKGENSYAIECFGGSVVKIGGNVNAEGNTSCGVYVESYNGEKALVEVGGDIVVSGENSQAAFLNADYTLLKVQGNVIGTGTGASGISAGGGDGENRCTAIIFGDIKAPVDAVNAWDSADVRVYGNVTATEEAASAVSAVGAMVQLHSNVTSEGKDGTGISVSAWDLADPVVGAMVKADGKITAYTPLRINGMPIEEIEHSEESVYAGYYTFTDGTNTVWAKPVSFIKIADPGSDTNSDSDSALNPQTGDSSNMVLLFIIGISALAIIAKRRRVMY